MIEPHEHLPVVLIVLEVLTVENDHAEIDKRENAKHAAQAGDISHRHIGPGAQINAMKPHNAKGKGKGQHGRGNALVEALLFPEELHHRVRAFVGRELFAVQNNILRGKRVALLAEVIDPCPLLFRGQRPRRRQAQGKQKDPPDHDDAFSCFKRLMSAISF